MRQLWPFVSSVLLALFAFQQPMAAMAQTSQPPTSTPPAVPAPDLTLFTTYPSQVIGIGETVTIQLKMHAGNSPQTVQLDTQQLPTGWTATFRGNGSIVQAVYVEANSDATVDLRVEPPANVAPGSYNFTVVGTAKNAKAELPIELTIKSKLPPKLSLSVDLPTLRGTPSTTFRYNATIKNEGDEDLSVNLLANAPNNFQVSFKLSGQDVTNIPLAANESKNLDIEAQPVGDVPAGNYPITIRAQGEDAEASLNLAAEVTGQEKLEVTSPDGNLSGQAYVGQQSPIKVVLRNSGTAPALNVQMTSTAPNGWTVDFNPKQISEIPPGSQVEVTANILPADKAVAGDYMITVQAQPADSASQSADFRITVLTSTLWGVAGIGLIAVALGVVALAVVRFGRR